MLECNLQLTIGKQLLKVNFSWDGIGILGLQGPSGCGKTTLLKSIAGLNKQSINRQSTINWNNINWQSSRQFEPPHKRAVTLVFQKHPLFPHMTVEQNLNFARKHGYRKISDNEYNALIKDFDCHQLLNNNSLQLSGGQQSRVAMVQGLLAYPELLLLDEPFSALDTDARHNCIIALKKYAVQLSISIIIVSHAPHELAAICEQLLIINNGCITGPHENILEKINNNSYHSISTIDPVTTFLEANLNSFDEVNHLAYFDVSGTEFLVSTKQKPDDKATIEVPASEVSLLLEQPTGTSIANCIPVTLKKYSFVDDGALLQLEFQQKKLSCKITQHSFKKLKLNQGKPLFAQFKATAIRIL
jgi:molybdate transport system ATP-binding protein